MIWYYFFFPMFFVKIILTYILLNFRGPILNQDIFKETFDRNTVEPLYLKINVQTIFCKLRFKIWYIIITCFLLEGVLDVRMGSLVPVVASKTKIKHK